MICGLLVAAALAAAAVVVVAPVKIGKLRFYLIVSEQIHMCMLNAILQCEACGDADFANDGVGKFCTLRVLCCEEEQKEQSSICTTLNLGHL